MMAGDRIAYILCVDCMNVENKIYMSGPARVFADPGLRRVIVKCRDHIGPRMYAYAAEHPITL